MMAHVLFKMAFNEAANFISIYNIDLFNSFALLLLTFQKHEAASLIIMIIIVQI